MISLHGIRYVNHKVDDKPGNSDFHEFFAEVARSFNAYDFQLHVSGFCGKSVEISRKLIKVRGGKIQGKRVYPNFVGIRSQVRKEVDRLSKLVFESPASEASHRSCLFAPEGCGRG